MQLKSAVILAFAGLMIACAPPATAGAERTAVAAPAQALRHVVLFQFEDNATPAQIREIETAFCRLPSATGLILDFEWGANVSPENLDQGFTHCFFLTFKDEADRDAYLPHPAHKEFGALLRPHLEKVCVIDYWTKP